MTGIRTDGTSYPRNRFAQTSSPSLVTPGTYTSCQSEVSYGRLDGDHEIIYPDPVEKGRNEERRMRPLKGAFHTQSPIQIPRSAVFTATHATPTLSTSLPHQNVVELLTNRPITVTPKPIEMSQGRADSFKLDNDPWTNDGLVQVHVPEVDEEEEHNLSHRTVITQGKRIVLPASPGLRLKKYSPEAVQNETLSFLEGLDLKVLLSSPRPDVLNFCQQGERAVRQRAETDQSLASPTKHVKDIPESVLPFTSTVTKKSSRKETTPDISSRLAYMEQTYGTTVYETRKARPETFVRLSNPISGHTSTLEALPPHQRKKRQETSNNQQQELNPKPMINGNQVVYEHPNQEEDQDEGRRKKSSRSGSASSSKQRSKRLAERKAVLKQKLQTKRQDEHENEPEEKQRGKGKSTFLTQNEDSEARISSQIRARLPRLHTHNATDTSMNPLQPVSQLKSVRTTARMKAPLDTRAKSSNRGGTTRATSKSIAAGESQKTSSYSQRGQPNSSRIIPDETIRGRPSSSLSSKSTSRRVQALSQDKTKNLSTATPSATSMLLMGTVGGVKAQPPNDSARWVSSRSTSQYRTNKKVHQVNDQQIVTS